MFGYIKLDPGCPGYLRKYFKQNYCLLCRGIEKHYGQLPRFLLSFDVTFIFTMLIGNKNEEVGKITCFNKTDKLNKFLSNELVKKAAALNIIFAYAKLVDNINDENSKVYKIILKTLKKIFDKAQKDFPNLWNIVINGYKKFDEYEKENRCLDDIEEMFSDLILTIAKEEFNVADEDKLDVLSYVAKWLYFIDACDDLDKDVKKCRFNPLKQFESNKKLFGEYLNFVYEHLRKIKEGVKIIESKDINTILVNRVVWFGIPNSTYKVIMRY